MLDFYQKENETSKMDIYTKPGYLFVVQVDHLSGECIGQVIDLFYQAGASNVQVVSSVTKKNRPSYMIFIDCREQYVETIEQTIVRELHVGGWHRIETSHSFLHNEVLNYEICVQKDDSRRTYSVQAKHFIGGGTRPEHDSVVRLKEDILNHFGCHVDYNTVYSFICAAIVNGHNATLTL
ncbi:MAG: nickel insertion protein [Lachnospiraceae bacterium]